MSVASFVFGDFVELDVRGHGGSVNLSAEEADDMAQALILAAARVRQLQTVPATCPLPLFEEFALLGVSAR